MNRNLISLNTIIIITAVLTTACSEVRSSYQKCIDSGRGNRNCQEFSEYDDGSDFVVINGTAYHNYSPGNRVTEGTPHSSRYPTLTSAQRSAFKIPAPTLVKAPRVGGFGIGRAGGASG